MGPYACESDREIAEEIFEKRRFLKNGE